MVSGTPGRGRPAAPPAPAHRLAIRVPQSLRRNQHAPQRTGTSHARVGRPLLKLKGNGGGRFKNSKVQRFKGAKVQRGRGAKVQRGRGSEVQRGRDSERQRFFLILIIFSFPAFLSSRFKKDEGWKGRKGSKVQEFRSHLRFPAYPHIRISAYPH